MDEIPTLTHFEFPEGTKKIDDCTREELLHVLKWAESQIEFWKRMANRRFT